MLKFKKALLFSFENINYFHIIGCRDGAVRLTGGSTSKEGTVEICYDDIWGLVSQSGWDNNATNVVCKQLGYSRQGLFVILYTF